MMDLFKKKTDKELEAELEVLKNQATEQEQRAELVERVEKAKERISKAKRKGAGASKVFQIAKGFTKVVDKGREVGWDLIKDSQFAHDMDQKRKKGEI